MAIRLGLDAKLYRNTGTSAARCGQLVSNVRDVTLNLETGEADVTTRGNAGWRATVGTLKDASIEFEMVWDTADYHFAALKDAFFNGTPVELLVMDGDMSIAGSQGLQAVCRIIKFTRSPKRSKRRSPSASRPSRPIHAARRSGSSGPIEFDA